MQIASFNVNSIRSRIEHITNWLDESAIDILAVQETKVIDDLFPTTVLKSINYYSYFTGQKAYNGVALISKHQISNVEYWHLKGDLSKRVIAATYNDIRIINVYVPNGQSIGSDKFNYKMQWLDEFITWVKQQQQQHEKIIILGDFNIAPADIDVFDANIWHDCILTSTEERAALNKLMQLGFKDSFRYLNPSENGFSWWDYRSGAFRRNHGLRIDLILTSHALDIKKCIVNKDLRKLPKPSDHTPVILTVEN